MPCCGRGNFAKARMPYAAVLCWLTLLIEAGLGTLRGLIVVPPMILAHPRSLPAARAIDRTAPVGRRARADANAWCARTNPGCHANAGSTRTNSGCNADTRSANTRRRPQHCTRPGDAARGNADVTAVDRRSRGTAERSNCGHDEHCDEGSVHFHSGHSIRCPENSDILPVARCYDERGGGH